MKRSGDCESYFLKQFIIYHQGESFVKVSSFEVESFYVFVKK